MAVYRYVPSSDELQAAMLDRVLADLPIPPRTADWRADVEALRAHVRQEAASIAAASEHPEAVRRVEAFAGR